jgi:tRNA ligase
VNEVASQYGFIETPYTVLNSVDEIKKLRQSVIDNGGMWNGEHVEGFVVRAALKPGSLAKQPHPNDLTEDNWSDKRRVFMWKIKSDEPYLMWREWRETTKKILTEKKKTGDDVAQRGKAKLAGSNKGKQPAEKKVETGKETGLEEAFSKACTNAFKSGGKASSSSKKSSAVIDETEDEPVQEQTEELSSRKKGKKGQSALVDLPSAIRTDRIRNPETRLYAIWVEKYMETHPEEFIEYQENRGIIAVRKAFEEWRATSAGKDMATKVLGEKATSAKSKTGAFERTLIVPIAVPGCGEFPMICYRAAYR